MASIFDNDFMDYIVDTFTMGKASTDKARKKIEDAGETYKKEAEDIAKNTKSAKELYQEGKEVAGATASNKAGIAKRNAKAAAMQNSGSKLMSAIQGAQAAVDASTGGFDEAAGNAATLGANIQNQQNALKAQGAQAKLNADTTSAEAQATQAQNRAKGAQQAFLQGASSLMNSLGKKE